ncbi:MAG: hemolysin family protein [Ardenticatenaceae bacterium]|nr:hemolysin family protein [Ardenticatenaceae bacterium]
MDIGTILYRFGLVLFLLAMNGFFVAIEFAVVTARRARIEQLAAEGNRAAAIVRPWLDDPDHLIAASQLGITVASLALGYLGEAAVAAVIEPVLHNLLGERAIVGVARSLPFLISLVVVTSFHVVLGEQAPKSAALRFPESLLLVASRPMHLFTTIFQPFITLLDRAAEFVLRLVGIQPVAGHHAIFTVDEIKRILSESQKGGVLDAGEREMLHNIFDFGETVARQVMTPRTEIVAVPAGATLDDLLVLAVETPHTKFPVYEGDLDHVIGIIHVKDLIAVLQRPAETRTGTVAADVTRDVLIVPETVGVEELLQTFRMHRTHLAILIDEFGGTAGLVTLEDLLEEIVGDVQDQFEEEEPDVRPLPDGCYLVSGLIPIEDFNAEFHTSVEDPNYDTIAGYLLGSLGRMAQVGDVVVIPAGTLRVEALDGLRIDRIRFCPGDLPGASEAAPTTASADRELD